MNSDRVIRVTQVGSEEELRELEESKVWNFLSSLLKEKLNSTDIDVDLYSNKTCLKVELLEDGTKYCIVLSRCMSGLCWGSGSSHKGQRACAAACSKEKRACRGGILPFLGLQKGRDTGTCQSFALGIAPPCLLSVCQDGACTQGTLLGFLLTWVCSSSRVRP